MRIICAFPGTGKSYCHQQYPYLTVDSDSDDFLWLKPDVRHPNWPNNYIENLENLINQTPLDKLHGRIFFLSTHIEVFECLEKNQLPYYIVKPKKEDKEIYMQRYIRRGSPEGFLKLMDKEFENFVDQLDNYNPEKIFELQGNETIFKVFHRIQHG